MRPGRQDEVDSQIKIEYTNSQEEEKKEQVSSAEHVPMETDDK